MTKLRDVLPDEARFDARFSALEVSGLAADSRQVKSGDLFVAVPGTSNDGLTFAADAVASGAVAVLGERMPSTTFPDHVAFVQVGDARRALAMAAARFFPRQPGTIAAVTGTSGKTSVVAFTRQMWSTLGYRAASVGTIGIITPTAQVYGSLTTPDPIALHRALDNLAGEGITHLAIEASSHGLDQRRLDGMRINVGAFTNLTRDHLDYHGSTEDYLRAKLRLFDSLIMPEGAAVIEADHDHAATMMKAACERGLAVLSVGRQGRDITLLATAIEGFTQTLQVRHAGKAIHVRLPLVGHFQVENALVAAGIAIATGGDPAQVFAALEHLKGAKGRLDFAGEKNGAPIFVDYAHKPDALAKALEALRPYTKNRLVVVFGAGGDRDRGKRPIMGAIAAEKADRVIITDDNPRSEDPAAIRAAILAACPRAIEIGNRGDAIRHAVDDLQPGDVLLIAGKGHESGQIVGNRVLPFADHEAVAAALGEKAT